MSAICPDVDSLSFRNFCYSGILEKIVWIKSCQCLSSQDMQESEIHGELCFNTQVNRVSLAVQMVNNLSTMQETWVWSLIPSLGREENGEGNGYPLQYFFSWRIPGGSLAEYSPWCLKTVEHDWVTFIFTFNLHTGEHIDGLDRTWCMNLLWHSVSQYDSLQPYRLYPVSLLYPWNFPGKNTISGAIFYSRESSRPGDRTLISVSFIGTHRIGILYHECHLRTPWICSSCCNKLPQWLKTVEMFVFFFPQFWRLEIHNQGVSRTMVPLKTLGKNSPLSLPSF